MFNFHGTIYGAPFSLQRDEPCGAPSPCAAPPDPETLREIRAQTCGVRVSASGAVAGSGVATPLSQAPDGETPEQRLSRLQDERRDHMIYFGALLGGLIVGLWVEGK